MTRKRLFIEILRETDRRLESIPRLVLLLYLCCMVWLIALFLDPVGTIKSTTAFIRGEYDAGDSLASAKD